MIKKVILITLCCITFNLFAQNNPEEELGAWYIFATNTKLTDNFSIQAQTQMRYYELLSEVQQFKIRVGGTYQFAKGFSGSLGYAYFRNDPSYLSEIPADFDEHRIYEVITFKNNLSPLKLTHRYMAEHRFFSNNNDVSHWMRYMLKIDIPLNEKWNLDIYDEIFLNLQKPNFAQNWLGGGISYAFCKSWKVRTGYFHQHFENQDFNRMVLALIWNIDLRKTKE